jgi:hypothetical protein
MPGMRVSEITGIVVGVGIGLATGAILSSVMWGAGVGAAFAIVVGLALRSHDGRN